jgi:MYXO-CTERM domain-containing protein
MRTSYVLAGLACVWAFAAADARADLGPAPSCPAGSHSQYLYGRHCVPDGSHLEADPNGGIRTVQDTPAANASGAPAPTAPSASAASPTPPTVTPPEATPPSKRGCACDVAGGASDGAPVALALVACALVVARRRRARD